MSKPLYPHQTWQPSNWTLWVSPGLYRRCLQCLLIAASLQHCQSHFVLLQRVSVLWLQSKHWAKNTALLGKKENTYRVGLCCLFFFSIFLPGSLNLKPSHVYLYDVDANHVNGFAQTSALYNMSLPAECCRSLFDDKVHFNFLWLNKVLFYLELQFMINKQTWLKGGFNRQGRIRSTYRG